MPSFSLISRLLSLKQGVRSRVAELASRQFSPERLRFSEDQAELQAIFSREPFAMYLHVPFCSDICEYCIFRRTTNTDRIDAYLRALLVEVELYAEAPVLQGRKLSSVHLGGGTPSLLSSEQLLTICRLIRSSFEHEDGLQITLEGNPESLLEQSIPVLLEAGIDRISVGVQALNDVQLAAMGRQHRRDTALRAIDVLQAGGMTNINADLIYGCEGQTVEMFHDDLRILVDRGVSHISAFPLIRGGRSSASNRDLTLQRERHAHMYSEVKQVLETAGLYQYSTEDFARAPGNESRYQTDAWRFPRKDIAALGPAALGYLSGRYYSNIPGLDRYSEAVDARRFPVARAMPIPRAEEARRDVLLGAKFLYVDRAAFIKKYGVDLEEALEPMLRLARHLGVWTVDRQGIHLTDEGSQMVSEIWGELIMTNLSDAATFVAELGERSSFVRN